MTLSTSTISSNSTSGFSGHGGGIYSYDGTLSLTGCTISRNSATGTDATFGGGICSRGTLTLSSCTISENSADDHGGGIYQSGGSSKLTDCTISENSAQENGGGIYNGWINMLTVSNSNISGNSAEDEGGGIYNTDRGTLTVTNATIAANLADSRGGGIYNDHGTLELTNSILALNRDNSTLDYENLYGSLSAGSGFNLIGIDPRFVVAPNPGLDGAWDTEDDILGDLRLLPESPAIDAGSNALAVDAQGDPLVTDILGNPRIQDGTVDMGAYEGATPLPEGTRFVVTSLADNVAVDGAITLREAIAAANTNEPVGDAPTGVLGGTDSIVFDASLFVAGPARIALGGSQLAIADRLEIEGPGADLLTIDAQQSSRVLRVNASILVGVSGVTITGGASDDDGGGIYNSGTLTVTNCTISGNSIGPFGSGGGIANSGILTVINSTISDNFGVGSYTDGGGIWNYDGTVMITNSSISGNSVVDGGGIYNYGTLTVTKSTLSGNSAEGSGGGIRNYGSGPLTVIGSTISGNQSHQGGGIYCGYYSRTVEITDSTILENSAYIGGGIYNSTDHKYSAFTVTNCTISGNSAWAPSVYSSYGGGIYNDGDGTSTIAGSIISGNSAKRGRAGGIYNSGTLTVTNSMLTGNSAADKGGGIYSSEGTLTVTNSSISGNAAGYRGGAMYNSGTLTVSTSTISGNSAEDKGGGIYRYSGTLTVTHTIVALNSAPADEDIFGDITPESGFNLIGIDPSFVRNPSPGDDGVWGTEDDDYGDLRLFFESPAVDAGSDALLPADQFDLDGDGDTTEPIPLDLAGNARVMGERVDIGAFETLDRFCVWEGVSEIGFGEDRMSILFNREITTLAPEHVSLLAPQGTVALEDVRRTLVGTGWSEYTIFTQPLVAAGEYVLTISPEVVDSQGERLDQDLDGTGGEAVEDQFVCELHLAGPRVVAQAPSGQMNRISGVPLSHFEFSFDRPMDRGLLELDEIVELTGPSGPIEATGYQWLDDQTLRILFDPVEALGTVDIVLGPEISDQWGNRLDQDGDGVCGEAEDVWRGSVTRVFSGSINQDTTIPSGVGVVVIDQSVTIAAGATLTIEPGVILKFAAGAGLNVDGNLDVRGTPEEPVIFTSWKDDTAGGDTNGDGSSTAPAPADWHGIYLTGVGASARFDHCRISYANYGVETAAGQTSWDVTNSVICNNIIGLGAHHQSELSARAVNCLVADNRNGGVYFHEYFNGELYNCTIVGNGFGGGWPNSGVHQVGTLHGQLYSGLQQLRIRHERVAGTGHPQHPVLQSGRTGNARDR